MFFVCSEGMMDLFTSLCLLFFLCFFVYNINLYLYLMKFNTKKHEKYLEFIKR